jgi:hypothetical protein
LLRSGKELNPVSQEPVVEPVSGYELKNNEGEMWADF